jgi:hypothetical protein
MAAQPFAALEAQVNALDKDTARRVARLVLECRSSLELALVAVQEANCTPPPCTDDLQPRLRGRLASILAVWQSALHKADDTRFR